MKRGLSEEEGTSFGKRGLCVGPAKVVCVCGSIPPCVLDDVEKEMFGVWDAPWARLRGMRYREEILPGVARLMKGGGTGD